MRSAAIALNDKCDEVSVSSTDVLEANVASIRVDLNELKTDFRAAVSRIDSDIKSAVSKLEGEIRAMGEKAEKDLRQFADHGRVQWDRRAQDEIRSVVGGCVVGGQFDFPPRAVGLEFRHVELQRHIRR